ncbi:MAG TPA: HigA family addiction module antitoxin [Acetobacteraceae bacterium]|nr:HigA family addiction module antitoxin [Acetobacteraceae bacterium]
MDGVRGPPSWRIHQLTCDRAATWSISASGNRRVTFALEEGEISDRNLEGGLSLMDDAPIKLGMRLSSPGEFIREEILAELGLPVAWAAALLGVRRATLSDLVNGKAGLSPEMALRASRRRSASTWIRCCACRHGTTATLCVSAKGRSWLSVTCRLAERRLRRGDCDHRVHGLVLTECSESDLGKIGTTWIRIVSSAVLLAMTVRLVP